VRKLQPKPTEQDEFSRLRQSLVETEARRMIECAMKFMRGAKREELCFEDLEAALKYLALSDIGLTYSGGCESAEGTGDPMYTDPQRFLEEELKCLALAQPQVVNGRWIYLNSKVPRTAANIHVSGLSEQA
jgi:hypothetical protein